MPTELVILPGVGHDATPSPAQVMELLKGIDRAAGWFDRYLALRQKRKRPRRRAIPSIPTASKFTTWSKGRESRLS